MLDQLAKIAVAGIAAYVVDHFIKKKTGKHIHEHAIDFVAKMWRRLKSWAARYLSEHPRVRKVYTSAISIAAEIKKAMNAGAEFVRVKVFGREEASSTAKIVKNESVPIDEIDAVLQQAKAEPILAMRY